MVRCTLSLALVAAVLCIALSAPIDEQAGLGCDIAVQNVENKAKDLVKKAEKVGKIPADTGKQLEGCLGQAGAPQLAALCVKNIVTNDENSLKIDGQEIEQELQQLEQQLENLAKQCLSSGGGGSGK